MAPQIPHIIRQKEQTLLDEVTAALQTPKEFPLLFNVWGIGGVGKSTCLSKLEEKCCEQASILKISFGAEEETPLGIMEKLYKQLPEIGLFQKDVRDLVRKSDPFQETLQTFKTTLVALETTPIEGQENVSKEQIEQVKLLSKLVANGAILGTQTFATGSLSLLAASATTATVNKAVDVAMDGAVAALSLKDSLLLKHPVTKKNQKLQELMETPLPKLTDSFVESISQRTKYKPIILVLDTYEKATTEVDSWLCQILQSNSNLKSKPIRIVVAGRYRLFRKNNWRSLPSNRNLICEIALKGFGKEETKLYLEQIGILGRQEVNRLQKSTNGLPFHLDLIRQEKEEGESINYSEEISDRLLKWLNKEQKQLVQLVACCRWFDRGLIEWLTNIYGLNFQTSADDTLNCFEWLTQFDIVEYVGNDRGWYCLKDVARDSIRKSLHQADRGKKFRDICSSLQKYFEGQADHEISPDASPPEKYEHLDWCQYTAEAIYYALFAMRREECKHYFLIHFFASRYFKEVNLIMAPFAAISAEFEIADNQLLPNENQKFLQSIQLLFPLGWIMMTSPPTYKVKFNDEIVPKAKIDQIESALSTCLAQVESLENGLAKFTGLMCKFMRCSPSQGVKFLRQVEEQAHLLNNPDFVKFSSGLYMTIGNAFRKIGLHTEALNNFEKAIEVNSECSDCWCDRGLALYELDYYGEALESFERAIQINPQDPTYWYNKGSVLCRLKRYDEALSSVETIAEISLKNSEYWNLRGIVFARLKNYIEALFSFDRAIEEESNDSAQYQVNRSILLAWMGQYKEAIEMCDNILENSKNNTHALYGKACCHALQNNTEGAIQYLNMAILQDPDETRKRATRDPEFDKIRDDSRFQSLVKSAIVDLL